MAGSGDRSKTIAQAIKDQGDSGFNWGRSLAFHWDAESQGIVATDQGGFVPTRAEWMELSRYMQVFYKYYGKQSVDEHNQNLWNEHDHPTRTERTAPTHKIKPGFVYLIHADNGMYKIGRTVQIHDRLTALSTKMPARLELVAHYHVGDMVAEELRWHNAFSDKRVVGGGEWFTLNDDDVALFMREVQP